jgi:membrane protein required for beta-lactamase induction
MRAGWHSTIVKMMIRRVVVAELDVDVDVAKVVDAAREEDAAVADRAAVDRNRRFQAKVACTPSQRPVEKTAMLSF